MGGISGSKPKIMTLGAVLYDRGFSFFPFHKANKLTPETFTTLNRTPGISPTLCPDRPNPETKTSSLSSMNVKQPSAGTKAVIFFPFNQLHSGALSDSGVRLFGF